MFAEWRDEALHCMTKHGVVAGDRDSEAFEKCQTEFYNKIVLHSQDNASLCKWLAQYSSGSSPSRK